jgi:hypothetical protein
LKARLLVKGIQNAARGSLASMDHANPDFVAAKGGTTLCWLNLDTYAQKG